MNLKKIFCLLLSVLLICSLAACGGSKENDKDFVWSRQGYFTDENGNMLYVIPSEDEEHPGWTVGCILEEGMHGWYIRQEGRTLHGNLVADYLDEDPFIVTVSEEGEDGLLLEIENGNTYHFTPTEMPKAAITVTVNTEGWGQIAYAKEGEEPVFEEDFPSQSAYLGLEGPETYVLAAKPDEGWKFMKWTKDGEVYSRDAQITVEFTESAAFVAVFGIAGTDETPVDLDTVTTLGQVLGLPDYGSSCSEDTYVYVFEQDEIFYRAIAECPKDVSDAVFALDWDDPQYDTKLRELISPLKVTRIENLTEAIPTQEELDQLVGKTGAELLDDGWYNSGWNLETMEFHMSHGPFEYTVVFEGTVKNAEDFEEEDIKPLVVKSVTYSGLGHATNLD